MKDAVTQNKQVGLLVWNLAWRKTVPILTAKRLTSIIPPIGNHWYQLNQIKQSTTRLQGFQKYKIRLKNYAELVITITTNHVDKTTRYSESLAVMYDVRKRFLHLKKNY